MMPDRIYRWGVRNAFAASLLMNLLLVIVMGAGIIHANQQRAEDIAREARQRAAALKLETRERDARDAEVAILTCKTVVRAVTAQSKTDDQAILNVIKQQRFAETGRPVPRIYTALEATITARQPPVSACEP